jgi:hypothetical protein
MAMNSNGIKLLKGGVIMKLLIKILLIMIFTVELSSSINVTRCFATDLIFESLIYLNYDASYIVPSGRAVKITSACVQMLNPSSGAVVNPSTGYVYVRTVNPWYFISIYQGNYSTGSSSMTGCFPVWVKAGDQIYANNAFWSGVQYIVQ